MQGSKCHVWASTGVARYLVLNLAPFRSTAGALDLKAPLLTNRPYLEEWLYFNPRNTESSAENGKRNTYCNAVNFAVKQAVASYNYNEFVQ